MNSGLKTLVILVLLIGVIAAASYLAVKRSKPKEEGMGYTAVLMCSDPQCGKQFEGRIIAGQAPPFVCKYCGKKTAYRAVRCLNCGAVFPYIVHEDPTRPESEEVVTQECPECGNRSFEIVPTKAELKEAEKKKKKEEE
jgi:DNA-directed RNA polymerase subunit RPC12/RpoP